jgi:hypothetical protein
MIPDLIPDRPMIADAPVNEKAIIYLTKTFPYGKMGKT